MDTSLLDRPAAPAPVPTQRRRRRRRGAAPRPDWACENCAAPNAGRRKRCTDCGTSRD